MGQWSWCKLSELPSYGPFGIRRRFAHCRHTNLAGQIAEPSARGFGQGLYEAENKGKAEPSGSQDMIGLVHPGINRLDYSSVRILAPI